MVRPHRRDFFRFASKKESIQLVHLRLMGPGDEVAIDIHRNLYAVVAQLLLHMAKGVPWEISKLA